jgi:hypothetical protein
MKRRSFFGALAGFCFAPLAVARKKKTCITKTYGRRFMLSNSEDAIVAVSWDDGNRQWQLDVVPLGGSKGIGMALNKDGSLTKIA